jgi:hypothetical protein
MSKGRSMARWVVGKCPINAVGAGPVAFCEAKRAIGPKGAAKDPPANVPDFKRGSILPVGAGPRPARR